MDDRLGGGPSGSPADDAGRFLLAAAAFCLLTLACSASTCERHVTLPVCGPITTFKVTSV